jgi:hypothetical protein
VLEGHKTRTNCSLTLQVNGENETQVTPPCSTYWNNQSHVPVTTTANIGWQLATYFAVVAVIQGGYGVLDLKLFNNWPSCTLKTNGQQRSNNWSRSTIKTRVSWPIDFLRILLFPLTILISPSSIFVNHAIIQCYRVSLLTSSSNNHKMNLLCCISLVGTSSGFAFWAVRACSQWRRLLERTLCHSFLHWDWLSTTGMANLFRLKSGLLFSIL